MASAKELRAQADELLGQARKVERQNKIDEQMEDAAHQLNAFVNALTNNGFTKEEAFELLKLTITSGGKFNG